MGLWDKDMTMGCKCDAGYSGADCSGRACKYGIDPLYVDDESTARVASSTYIVRPGFDGLQGTYAIKFYDVFGEDYETAPILASQSTTCLDVVGALEALPNTVIPGGSVFCSDYWGQFDELLGSYEYADTNEGGFHMYSLTFTGNPGYLKPIEIDSTLDGTRATTNTTTAVWSDGMSGEFTDYFATQCEYVYTTITPVNGGNPDGAGDAYSEFGSTTPTMLGNVNVYGYLDDLTATETKLLKKCLGDSDGYTDNNVEVYDWDYGATMFYTEQYDTYIMSGTPHAIKLVKRLPNDDFDGGKFALIWWSPKDEKFYVATKASDMISEYAIFTTDGVAERVYMDANSDSAYNATEVAVTAYFTQFSNTLYMSLDALLRRHRHGRLRLGLRRHDGPLHHHQDLEVGGDVQDGDVRGQVPHHRRQGHQLGRLDRRRPRRRRHQEHGLRADRQVHAGDDGHVHVRLAVLEPRPLQRRRRALRVLQGLHERQLRHAVVARGVSARIISQRSAKGRVRTKAHDEGAGCRVYTRGATARRGFRIEK